MGMDDEWSEYRTAKSTRPLWANALIVAAVLAIAFIAFVLIGPWTTAMWFGIAVVVALLVAAIAALTRR